MKAYVDQDLCIGCGLCAGLCPSVFEMNADGKSEAVQEPGAEDTDITIEARDSCPVSAISVEE